MTRTLEDLWALVAEELPPLPTPPAEPVPAAPPAMALLNQVDRLLRLYVWFPSAHHSRALALWVLHTWAIGAASATPYMALVSPEKRSGKTRALELLELVCRAPVRASSITAAGVFQSIEKWTPSLLVDEVDATFTARGEQAEALRAVLNAGNRRGSYVVRGTQEGEPVRFSVFCPKVLSGINAHWPDTVTDRSVILSMQRKRVGKDVGDFFASEVEAATEQLRTDLANWARAATAELAAWRRPGRVPGLTDRQQEAWDPLLAIADHAGEPWAWAAREAARALADDAAQLARDSDGHLLLVALAAMFDANGSALSSKDICRTLNEDEELPFGAKRRGDGLDPRGLARLLRPYGIRPENVRVGGEIKKGYHRDGFDDVWARYTPPGDPADERYKRYKRYTPPTEPNPRSGDVADDTDGRDVSATQIRLHERDVADVADVADSSNGAGARMPEPCSYAYHRSTDWRLNARDGGAYPWRCGICHPPPFGLDIERRESECEGEHT